MEKVAITKEKWNAMSPEEKALCKALGIGVAPEVKRAYFEKTKVHRSKPLDEYVLGVLTTCTLCKEVEVQSFKMKLDQKSGHYFLTGEIETTSLPHRFRTQDVNVCRNCKYKLATWTKQELLDRLVKECSMKEADKLIRATSILEPQKKMPDGWREVSRKNGGKKDAGDCS
jgi:hypothetical protein